MNPHFDELDLYLDDLLPPIRKAAFEALMEADKELKESVASEKAYRAAQSVLAKEELRKRLTQVNAEAEPIVKKKRELSWAYYAIAASFVGISGLLFWFLSKDGAVDKSLLAQKYNIEYPIPTIQGTGNAEAYQFLEAHQYTDAINQLEQIPVAQQTDDHRFFIGYACLQNKEYQKAETTFRMINSGPLLEAAQWYAVVAALYLQKNVKADLAEIASNSNHAYRAKASSLLKEMR